VVHEFVPFCPECRTTMILDPNTEFLEMIQCNLCNRNIN